MASITAVELGADSCALARTSVRGGQVHVSATEILDPAAFPGIEAFTMALKQTRRSMRLPRRCRAVVWGLPDGANRRDAAVKPLLEPLTGAGFKVERVVSPCNALAALARLKSSRGEGSTCWLAINRGGVAIVVVRPGKQLYAHSFAWDSSIGASGSQARLLQRYSLVSFLSPEVKRAMAEARKYGTPVEAVVTCGNLPDLRSLTMPLIEELDVEVETLDSLEGLVVKPQAVEKIGESAPAIRLACAAAIARGTRPWDPSKKRASSGMVATYARAAVLAAAVVGLGYVGYVKMRPGTSTVTVLRSRQVRSQLPLPITPRPLSLTARRPEPPPHAKPAVVTPPPTPPPPAAKAPVAVAVNKANPPATAATKPPAIPWKPAATVPPPPAAKAPAPAVNAAAKKPESKPPAVSVAAKRPELKPVPPPIAKAPAVNATNTVPRAPLQPLVTIPVPNTPVPSAPRPLGAPVARAPAPSASAPPPAARSNPPAVSIPPPVPKSNPALNPPAPSSDKPEAGVPVRSSLPGASAAPRGPMPALLKDAVPRVTAILVARDRRFATVDGGQIIGIGDRLGRRTVVGMDERSVVLQEPSGVQIRIGLGGRVLGVERAPR